MSSPLYHIVITSDASAFLHSLRCFKSKQIDAGCQNVSCQCEKGNVALLLLFILFCQDLGLMVETVECICKIVNICTDLVWCKLFVDVLHYASKLRSFQHQSFFALACSRKDLNIVHALS